MDIVWIRIREKSKNLVKAFSSRYAIFFHVREDSEYHGLTSFRKDSWPRFYRLYICPFMFVCLQFVAVPFQTINHTVNRFTLSPCASNYLDIVSFCFVFWADIHKLCFEKRIVYNQRKKVKIQHQTQTHWHQVICNIIICTRLLFAICHWLLCEVSPDLLHCAMCYAAQNDLSTTNINKQHPVN